MNNGAKFINWFSPDFRVLIVCTANVCRSPLAEAMLRHRLQLMGIGRRVQVRSAGTRVGQRGRQPDPRVARLCSEAGIKLGRIRARQLDPAMIQGSEYVLVMDREHLHDVATFTGSEEPQDKVELLGCYLPGEAGSDCEIRDPYYGDWLGFQTVFEQIDATMPGLLESIKLRLSGLP